MPVVVRPLADVSRGAGMTRHGGTQGSPMSPLLRRGAPANRSWAPAGQSPASPAEGWRRFLVGDS
jgi:hypothetical protein